MAAVSSVNCLAEMLADMDDLTEVIRGFRREDLRGVAFRQLLKFAVSEGRLCEGLRNSDARLHQLKLGPLTILLLGPCRGDPLRLNEPSMSRQPGEISID